MAEVSEVSVPGLHSGHQRQLRKQSQVPLIPPGLPSHSHLVVGNSKVAYQASGNYSELINQGTNQGRTLSSCQCASWLQLSPQR